MELTLEQQLNEAVEKITAAWNAFGVTVSEMAEALNRIFSEPKLWPKRKSVSPKKYGMSLRKRRCSCVLCYQYIPLTPRNRPYQRRAY